MSHLITAPDITQYKSQDHKITMVTAYDYTMATIFDEAGVDSILVGDSLGMVVQGREDTLGVTLEQMIYHTHCVVRGTKRAHVVCDLPFMSYHASKNDAISAAGQALKEGKAAAVKMEGGEEIADIVHAVTLLGIPVMGHVGLMPMRIKQMGGYKVQGRNKESAKKIINDAKAIEAAGAYALVLEGVPAELADRVTREINIPTIGIGSGPHCNGQVLVGYDLLGMYKKFTPKFVKKYSDLHSEIVRATREFVKEVQSGKFPNKDHSYSE